MGTLIYSASQFPQVSLLWSRVESFLPSSSFSTGKGKCATVGLILATLFSSVAQAVFGTVCSMSMELNRNDTATVEKIGGFFSKYAVRVIYSEYFTIFTCHPDRTFRYFRVVKALTFLNGIKLGASLLRDSKIVKCSVGTFSFSPLGQLPRVHHSPDGRGLLDRPGHIPGLQLHRPRLGCRGPDTCPGSEKRVVVTGKDLSKVASSRRRRFPPDILEGGEGGSWKRCGTGGVHGLQGR